MLTFDYATPDYADYLMLTMPDCQHYRHIRRRCCHDAAV